MPRPCDDISPAGGAAIADEMGMRAGLVLSIDNPGAVPYTLTLF